MGDAQALLGGDQVVVDVIARVDLHPLHGAVEVAILGGVVIADQLTRVMSDITRLIAGVEPRHGGRDRPLADQLLQESGLA